MCTRNHILHIECSVLRFFGRPDARQSSESEGEADEVSLSAIHFKTRATRAKAFVDINTKRLSVNHFLYRSNHVLSASLGEIHIK